jgi:hypothetical protein
VSRLVTKIAVGRQLVTPLCALAVAAGLYASLVGWNVWIAVFAGCGVYFGVLLWADGSRLASFLQAMSRKPALESRAA